MKPPIRHSLSWLAFAAVLAAGLAVAFWPRPLGVETATVARGAMAVELIDEGKTRIRDVYEVSAPVAGSLRRVRLRAGDAVVGSKTVVAELAPAPPSFRDRRDRAEAEAAVRAAEATRDLAAAGVTGSEAELAYAEAEFGRMAALRDRAVVSAADLDAARLARDTRAAELATARATLAARSYDLARAQAALAGPADGAADGGEPVLALTAPVSGRVLRIFRDSAAVVVAGAAIADVGDPHNLEIVVDVLSPDAVGIRPGSLAGITDWGGDARLAARVRLVEPSGFTKTSALGVEEQRVNVILDPAGDPAAWAAVGDGYRVTAHLPLWSGADVLQVPIAAMFRTDAGWSVFVVRDGRAVLTPIEVGHLGERTAEVLGGLDAGDTVIVHPGSHVADGVGVAPDDRS